MKFIQQPKSSFAIEITPLIDIVFLLVIFFVVCVLPWHTLTRNVFFICAAAAAAEAYRRSRPTAVAPEAPAGVVAVNIAVSPKAERNGSKAVSPKAERNGSKAVSPKADRNGSKAVSPKEARNRSEAVSVKTVNTL